MKVATGKERDALLRDCLKQRCGNQGTDGFFHIHSRRHSLISTFLPAALRLGLKINLDRAFRVSAMNQKLSYKLKTTSHPDEKIPFFFLSHRHNIGLHG